MNFRKFMNWRYFFSYCFFLLIAFSSVNATENESSQSAGITSKEVANMPLRLGDPHKAVLKEIVTPVLKKNAKHYFYGTFEAESNITSNILVGSYIRCLGPTRTNESVFTTLNNNGIDVGKIVSVVRWLFTVPEDGSYTCKLVAYASKSHPSGHEEVTVLPGRYTYLWFNDKDQKGALEWSYEKACSNPERNNPIEAGQNRIVLRKVREASKIATKISVNGDVELTTNNHAGRQGAKARVTLYATQTDRSGKPCAKPFTDTKNVKISWGKHHSKVFASLSVTFSLHLGSAA